MEMKVSAAKNLYSMLWRKKRPVNVVIFKRVLSKNYKSNWDENLSKFIELKPLALKNHVNALSAKVKQKPCISQMTDMLMCLEKFDQNQSMCDKEIKAFQSCFDSHKASQVGKRQGKKKSQQESLPTGQYAKMTNQQMTTYLRKFPLSEGRKNYVPPEYCK